MNTTKFFTALALATTSQAIRLQWEMPAECQDGFMMGTYSFDNPPEHCVDPNSAEALAATAAVDEEAKWNALGKTKPVFPATSSWLNGMRRLTLLPPTKLERKIYAQSLHHANLTLSPTDSTSILN